MGPFVRRWLAAYIGKASVTSAQSREDTAAS